VLHEGYDLIDDTSTVEIEDWIARSATLKNDVATEHTDGFFGEFDHRGFTLKVFDLR
jgi:hypothetical protein